MLIISNIGCNKPSTQLIYDNPDVKVIFLHHSTGRNVWYGDVKQRKVPYLKTHMCMVPRILKEYNDLNARKINLEERYFPSGETYPWKNYPFDYYNIWVKNAGDSSYMGEPTLEMLTKVYDIIIIKHCFPVSNIQPDEVIPNIDSEIKTVANYKLQYESLREKMHQFPDARFIIWTGAALTETQTTFEQATRAKAFYEWVMNEWDMPYDNIEIFDFRAIETEGGLYLKPEFAVSKDDSHPNIEVSSIAAEAFARRITEVVEACL